ncbi:MAG: OmpH family outer membrane protein, partial [Balneolaceae bacterium]
MIKKSIVSGFVLFIIAFSLQPDTVQAQDMKIGFVEPRAILERMPEMRAVQQRMQNYVERKSDELAELERELQSEIEAYQQKVGVISDAARQEEEERLGQMQFELQQSQNEAQQEMQERRAELMAPLLEQLQSSIDTVASEKGIDYVLNTTTQTGDVI